MTIIVDVSPVFFGKLIQINRIAVFQYYVRSPHARHMILPDGGGIGGSHQYDGTATLLSQLKRAAMDSTENEKLVQLLTNFREQMYRYRVEYLKKRDIYPQLVNEHQEILRCLKLHDADAAIAAMRNHIDKQQRIMNWMLFTRWDLSIIS